MEYLTIFFGLMVVLFAIGIPIAISIGLTCLVVLVISGGWSAIPTELFALQMMRGLNNFPILAIPFFIFAASLMNVGTIASRIFNFANALVGHIRGGLGHVNVMASMIFSGMSSTAVADVAGLGQLELKAMRERGYPRRFAVGITGASSIISPMIPPSIALVVYGWQSGTSIASLFIAGLVPGVLVGLSLMMTSFVVSFWIPLPRSPWPGMRETLRLFWAAFPPLMTPMIIVGGIWSGIFTPTEAGAIASIYALFLGFVVYGDLNWKSLMEVLSQTVRFSSIILFIIAIATFYGWLLVRLRIPQELAMLLSGLDVSNMTILFAMVLFFLAIGCFMSVVEAILIFTPIFMLTIQALGIDPVYFGILMVLALSVGVITPPFGNVLFVLIEITGLPFEKVVAAVAPFIIPILLVIVLLVIFPGIVTFLPDLFSGR
ncbi:TRAP transporter large permease subunit [Aliihoeflea aestuarii]|uniref:TRAP transporter large permease n=1 Tax=Aliihoeflea aestuarii TaxID=453840 RepID=UPI002092F2EB|nr:TRAP transporter large permease [Aliihoeflea aestuarii]MCO6389551.1 TRAP transporter large permease subunit [Aliihoeflea aestuarii]